MPEPIQTLRPERGLKSAAVSVSGSGINSALHAARRFEFERDSFTFANELIWAYHFDSATAKTTFSRRETKPDYTQRCFVLARAAKQFFLHVRFDPALPAADDQIYRGLIRRVVARNPRIACAPGSEIVIPGFANLREFSRARESLLKAECGGAWRSYLLRSHWRMIFPISRTHQARTASRLAAVIRVGGLPIIHLVLFPKLTINHGMVLFDVSETPDAWMFRAYDPNEPRQPAQLAFNRGTRAFSLPTNQYWAGGELDVIEIYRGWFM